MGGNILVAIGLKRCAASLPEKKKAPRSAAPSKINREGLRCLPGFLGLFAGVFPSHDAGGHMLHVFVAQF